MSCCGDEKDGLPKPVLDSTLEMGTLQLTRGRLGHAFSACSPYWFPLSGNISWQLSYASKLCAPAFVRFLSVSNSRFENLSTGRSVTFGKMANHTPSSSIEFTGTMPPIMFTISSCAICNSYRCPDNTSMPQTMKFSWKNSLMTTMCKFFSNCCKVCCKIILDLTGEISGWSELTADSVLTLLIARDGVLSYFESFERTIKFFEACESSRLLPWALFFKGDRHTECFDPGISMKGSRFLVARNFPFARAFSFCSMYRDLIEWSLLPNRAMVWFVLKPSSAKIFTGGDTV